MGSNRAVILILLTAGAFFHLFSAVADAADMPYKKGELLVQFKAGASAASRAGLQRTARVRRSRPMGRSGIRHIILADGTTVNQALAVYANDPNVEFAEPNYMIHSQNLPDDTHFNLQWGLYNTGQTVNGFTGTPGADMDAVTAWDTTTGSGEIVVALVDTGCDLSHPDLAPNIWTNPQEIPANGLDDDGNGLIDDVHGWDFADGDNDPQDAGGHGSHVGGIIAAAGDNARGIAGVAWQVKIMPLRFMNAFGEGSTADAIEAIEYALSKGAKIINCSWGGTGYSSALQSVMADGDALFVCAAGNSAGDNDLDPFYPAGFSDANILSVAASDQMDRLAWFSNYGSISVDVSAPGVRIYSLDTGRRTLWQESFDVGLPEGWSTGGSGDAWAVADLPSTADAPALAVSPGENYTNNADNWIEAPLQDLSQVSAAQLIFQITGRTEAYADYLYLEVSVDGSTWYSRPVKTGSTVTYGGISGSIAYWTTASVDLGPWDGAAQLYLRLRFKSDASETDMGYYIDDMQLTAAGEQESYQFMQGTSMAAGYVSGLAALILSRDDGLSPVDLKAVIENSVDLNQNLLEQVAAGGRVNALNALTLLPDLSLTAASSAADRIQLSWSSATPLTSQVVIERRTEGQSVFETIARVDAAAVATYADNALPANATYYYRVQAETREGRSGYSNQTLATTLETSSAGGGGGGGGGCFITSLTGGAIR